jgi:ligand-binding sensor domain-containing protein
MLRSFIFIALISLLTKAQAQTITNYTTNEGLPDNDVTCLVHDGNGIMWFGTQQGVAKYDGVTWTIHNTSTNSMIPQNAITAIAIGNDQDIWIGTDEGVAVYNGATWAAFTISDGLGSNRINHISRMSNGDIWFGDFNGATKYDGTSFVTYGSAEGLPFGGVVYVKEDANGDVLLCSGLGGLITFDGSDFTTYSVNEGLVSKNTSAVALDSKGAKWIGTANGVTVIDATNEWVENHTQMLTIPEPDTLNPVEDIAIDNFGNVWVGIYVDYLVTVGGVAMYDGAKWTTFDQSNGLVGPTIRKIALDGRGNLWVGTSSGVSKIASPTASVEDILDQNNGFAMYPNPAEDFITISLKSNSSSPFGVNIYNTQWQSVEYHSSSNTEVELKLSVSDLCPGIYYVVCGQQVKQLLIH